MRKLLWLIVCLMTITVGAVAQEKQKEFNYLDYQKTVKTVGDDTYVTIKEQTPSIMLAGKYLKYSANFEIATILSSAASGTLFILANNEKSDTGKETYRTFGAIFGGLAFACYIGKVSYKWKSGKTLECCGNGVRLNF